MQIQVAVLAVLATIAAAAPSSCKGKCNKNDPVLLLIRNSKLGPKINAFCSSYIGSTTSVAYTKTTVVQATVTAPVVTLTVAPTLATTTVTRMATLVGPGIQKREVLDERAVPIQVPAELAAFAAPKISSACSCFLTSVPTPATVTATTQAVTVSSVVTAPAVTTTVTQVQYLYTKVVPSPTCPQASVPTPGSQVYPLRIEGSTGTIFEGSLEYNGIVSNYGYVSLPSGGNHSCDGTNNNANPTPKNTGTNSLYNAALACGFGVDGTWSSSFNDFFITSIGTSPQTSTQFWGLLKDYQFTPTGGCQSEFEPSQELQWVFDAFNKSKFLKLTASARVAAVGESVQLKVVDGMNGNTPVAGATVGTVVSDASGTVSYPCTSEGLFGLKATEASSVRSNRVYVYCYTPGSGNYV